MIEEFKYESSSFTLVRRYNTTGVEEEQNDHSLSTVTTFDLICAHRYEIHLSLRVFLGIQSVL